MMFEPFRNEHADPWDANIVDYEALNRPASDAIVESIEATRAAAPTGPETLASTSLLILGPAGSGKTHLFARARRRSGPRAAFVLLRPLIAAEPSPRMVLAAMLDALSRPSIGTDARQLDVVVGSLLASVGGSDSMWPHVLLEQYRSETTTFRADRLEAALARVEDLYPEVSVTYLEQLLRTPFLDPVERRASVAWLSGRDLSVGQLARIGMPNAISDVDVMPAVRTLAIVAAFGAPIVLVFDQLENLVDMTGDERVIAHGNLVSELLDATRGLTLVQMALDGEWARRIRPALSASQRSRVEANVIELSMPTPADRRELVRAWIERLPEAERSGPFPAPFTQDELDRWLAREVMTPRMLLLECREALERARALTALPSVIPPPLDEELAAEATESVAGAQETLERLEQLWGAHLQQARRELVELAEQRRPVDSERMASGLLQLLRLAGSPGAALKRSRHSEWIEFQADADGGRRQLRIVQQANHRSVASALHEAAHAAEECPVLVVRERHWEFPPSWHKTHEALSGFVAVPGARFELIERDDVVRLLALDYFLSAATSQDLDGLDGVPIPRVAVDAFVGRGLGWESWPVTSMLARQATSEEVERDAVPPASDDSSPATNGSSIPHAEATRNGNAAMDALHRLKVASTDRIFAEVRCADRSVSRAAIVEQLRAAGDGVRWFGPSLVCLAEVAS